MRVSEIGGLADANIINQLFHVATCQIPNLTWKLQSILQVSKSVPLVQFHAYAVSHASTVASARDLYTVLFGRRVTR